MLIRQCLFGLFILFTVAAARDRLNRSLCFIQEHVYFLWTEACTLFLLNILSLNVAIDINEF